MVRTIATVLACTTLVAAPAIAGTKAVTALGYALPKDKPVTIVLMRPDTDVGELAAGGVPQPERARIATAA